MQHFVICGIAHPCRDQVKYCIFLQCFDLFVEQQKNNVLEVEYGFTGRPDLDLWPAFSIP